MVPPKHRFWRGRRYRKVVGPTLPMTDLAVVRTCLRITADDLASQLGVSRTTIERWEWGLMNPAYPELFQLAVEAVARRRLEEARANGEAELAALAEHAIARIAAWWPERPTWRPVASVGLHRRRQAG